MTFNLTSKQACVLRSPFIEQRDLEPPPTGLLDASGNIIEGKAEAALAQHDAEQKSKRAEIEAAYRDGFIDGCGSWYAGEGTTYAAWMDSDTKKSLEEK